MAKAVPVPAPVPVPPPAPAPELTVNPGLNPGTTPEMGGPLLVTPAGTTMVATDALHTQLERLTSLHGELSHQTRGLAAVTARANWVSVPMAPAGARRSEFELDAALISTRSATALSERLIRALREAIARYDHAERAALARGDRLAAVMGAELGPIVRSMLPGIALLGGLGFLASKVPDPGGKRASLVREFFLQHPELITGTRFVQGVRMFTDGLDEGTSTFLGIPAPLAVAMGAVGVTGVGSSARGLLAVGPLLGLFRETPVGVQRVSTAVITDPPVGAVARLERVPEVNQVRIEKYAAPGAPDRFVVYVGPTETFSPVADHEPWDLTSNVGGVGGLDVGSFRATEMAMQDAGIGSTDAVQFVGFSQGGLVATMLAGSGEWNAAGLETFGAPAGNIALPDGIQGLAIRNTDDFIPMLAGPQLDHHLVQVERQAFSDGTPLPTYHAAPAHQRDAYMATATVVDRATSSAVKDQSAALDAFTADYASRPDSTVTAMTYHGERLPEPAKPVDLKAVTMEARLTSSAR